jgi:glucuronate isomerase
MNEAEIWQIKQQAKAWESVHDALSEGNPYFTGAGGTGEDNAVAEIRRLYAVNAAMERALQEIAAIDPANVNQFARGWIAHTQEIARAAILSAKESA